MFSNIQFFLDDDLIYYTNFANRKRLCLLKEFEKKIFEQTHDNNSHVDFNRTYETIIVNFYFRKLNNRLHRYIAHCHQCNLCQTKRHASYDNLNLIVSSSILFYIVCFDFILAFSKRQEMNVALTTTCMFSKKSMIMIDKNTYSAKDWIDVMIDDLVNWEMSRAFIHDKDKKFLFVFWKTIFKKLSVQYLAFVVYHSQINDQSERTNQIVEIVLRYILTINLDLDWMTFLSIIRARLNNFFNTSIDLSFNEIIMKFKTRDSFALLKHDEFSKNWLKRKTINVIKTEIVIVWVNLTTKIVYDKHHKFLKLKMSDQVFLRLHKRYFLSFVKSSKLSIQRIESFKILEKKSNLTYKLDILKNWKIHFVIFIAHLESILNDDDLYDRERSSHSKSIVEFNKNWHDYEVESLLKHRIKRYDRDKSMFEYLIR